MKAGKPSTKCKHCKSANTSVTGKPPARCTLKCKDCGKSYAICGAKTKSGAPCGKAPMANGRCRLDGGAPGSGRPIIHGKYSANLPKSLRDAYEKAEADSNLLALRSDVALFEALIVETLPKLLSSDEHAVLWESANDQFNEITKALTVGDISQARLSLQLLGQVLKNGVAGVEAEERALTLIERKAKIQELEHKRLKMLGDHLTSQQAMTLIAYLMSSITTHVKDPNALRSIQHDFARASGQFGERSALEAG